MNFLELFLVKQSWNLAEGRCPPRLAVHRATILDCASQPLIENTDGYFENTTTGEDEGDTEQFLVRGTMTADVGSNSLITLKAEYADYKVQGNVGEIFGRIIATS